MFQDRAMRLTLLAVLAVLCAGLATWYLSSRMFAPASAVGGPFTMMDRKGAPVTERDFAGKPMVLAFGFTFCPDVCPTTLAEMSGWLDALGPDAGKLTMVFATVDPERDTPAKLGDYVAAFDNRIVPLAGTPEQVTSITKAFRAYYRKVKTGDGPDDYTIDHSTVIYLMDGRGRFVTSLRYTEPEEQALAKLRDLISGG